MVLGLTTGQQLGIAAVAAVFIAFALLVSFALPARDHNFPGARLRPFLLVVVLLFVAMMSAIVFLAKEDEAEGNGGEAAATETAAEEETGGSAEAGGGELPGGGDEVDDEAVETFTEAGCAACHTLAAANATGTVGPSLDETQVTVEQAAEQIRTGGGGMPPFEGQLTEEEIQALATLVAGG